MGYVGGSFLEVEVKRTLVERRESKILDSSIEGPTLIREEMPSTRLESKVSGF